MIKPDIRKLNFDTNLTMGMEIVPIDQHYVANSENLILPHRAGFYCILNQFNY